MFKRLRIKFLFMYLCTVILLVLLFFTVFLFTTYKNMELASNEEIIKSEYATSSPEILPNDTNSPPRFLPPIIITLNNEKQIIDVKCYTDIDNSYFTMLTTAALSKNKTEGKLKIVNTYYKFSYKDNKLIFLDISNDMQMINNIITTFLYVGIPMLIFLFFISYNFAKKSIKPIEESFEKQKEFISNASHELKTPLTAISANADVLLEGLDKDQKKWLSNIRSETEHMAKLTDTLLHLTKVDFSNVPINIEIVNFSSLLERHLISLEAVLYEKKIKTKIIIEPNIKLRFESEQLSRLISVLIDNAIKYTDGEIEISLDKIKSYARLIIHNTGNGISEEELPKIWDKFYRGDKSRSSTRGFGLGLPIAKAITESCGGTIKAESIIGKYTRFTVKLPLA